MTEPIIIDGVDVSGCKLYLYRDKQPKGSRSCGEGLVDCNGKDCLFKKLQRKTQECAELKEKISKVLELSKKGVNAYEYCIQELEQENEKLRGKMKPKENLVEEKLNKLPFFINKRITQKCECCGKAEIVKNISYELQFKILPNCDGHRYLLYYYADCYELTSSIKYIGTSCGIGFDTIEEAIEDLKKHLSTLNDVDEKVG